mgnify:FL=1
MKINRAPDILANVLSKRTHQKIVGFAAETNTDPNIFKEKWDRKKVDLLIGNKVNSGATEAKQGFGQNQNEYFFIKEGVIKEQKVLTKTQLADYIQEETK